MMSDETRYDAEDVKTWNEEVFTNKVSAKLRAVWTKAESIKYLMRDGKQVVAFEQLQGMSDSVGFLVELFNQRLEGFSGNQSENDTD